tara:strand:- start:4506 stop:5642 length:1137 start_codon:yes stop_codon:yes gene_type:complete
MTAIVHPNQDIYHVLNLACLKYTGSYLPSDGLTQTTWTKSTDTIPRSIGFKPDLSPSTYNGFESQVKRALIVGELTEVFDVAHKLVKYNNFVDGFCEGALKNIEMDEDGNTGAGHLLGDVNNSLQIPFAKACDECSAKLMRLTVKPDRSDIRKLLPDLTYHTLLNCSPTQALKLRTLIQHISAQCDLPKPDIPLRDAESKKVKPVIYFIQQRIVHNFNWNVEGCCKIQKSRLCPWNSVGYHYLGQHKYTTLTPYNRCLIDGQIYHYGRLTHDIHWHSKQNKLYKNKKGRNYALEYFAIHFASLKLCSHNHFETNASRPKFWAHCHQVISDFEFGKLKNCWVDFKTGSEFTTSELLRIYGGVQTYHTIQFGRTVINSVV